MKKELYIPVNVPERNDLFDGFGLKELALTGVSLLVGVITAVILYSNTKNTVPALFAVLIIVVMTVFFIKRDRFDESLIDKINFVRKYHKSQKRHIFGHQDDLRTEGDYAK